MDRRKFLKQGLIGGAVIHFWSFFNGDLRALAASSEPTKKESNELFFDDQESLILIKFIDGILGDIDKDHRLSKKEITEKTLANVNFAALQLAPHTQKDLKLLFKILGIRPLRFTMSGFWKPWSDLERKDIDQILNSWSTSTLSIRRSAYEGLRDLILASWYGDQNSWSMINYPGVPQL